MTDRLRESRTRRGAHLTVLVSQGGRRSVQMKSRGRFPAVADSRHCTVPVRVPCQSPSEKLAILCGSSNTPSCPCQSLRKLSHPRASSVATWSVPGVSHRWRGASSTTGGRKRKPRTGQVPVSDRKHTLALPTEDPNRRTTLLPADAQMALQLFFPRKDGRRVLSGLPAAGRDGGAGARGWALPRLAHPLPQRGWVLPIQGRDKAFAARNRRRDNSARNEKLYFRNRNRVRVFDKPAGIYYVSYT